MRTSASTGFRLNRLLFFAWYLLLVLTLSLYLLRLRSDGPYGKDFTIFMTGATVIAGGQGANLYDLDAQASAQRLVVGPQTFKGGLLPFNYPPYVAAPFLLLTLTTPDVAYYIWVAAQWAVLAALALSISAYYRREAHATPKFALLLLFSFAPIIEALLMGQMSIILLALWWWIFLALRDESTSSVGASRSVAMSSPRQSMPLNKPSGTRAVGVSEMSRSPGPAKGNGEGEAKAPKHALERSQGSWPRRLWTLDSGLWTQVGVGLALAAFKPQMALLLVAGLAAQRRWRALIYAGLAQAVLWLIALVLLGPGVLGGYVRILQVSVQTTGTLGFYPAAMPNLRGLLTTLAVPSDLSLQLAMLGWLLSVAASALLWRMPWSVATRMGVTVVLAVLFSPHLYVHDASLLALAPICAQLASTERGLELDMKWVFALCVALFLAMYSVVFQVAGGYALLILAVWTFGSIMLAFLLNIGAKERAVARMRLGET